MNYQNRNITTKSNNSKQESNLQTPKYSTSQTLVNYYITLMFTIFPLFFSNAYFNIRHDKYNLFLILSSIILVAEILIFIFSYNYKQSSNLSNQAKNRNNSVVKKSKAHKNNSSFANKYIFKSFTLPDIAMLALLVFSFISALLSEYKTDAFLGAEKGRNHGFLIIALYVAIYFLITRCFYYIEYIFYALSITCIAIYILAILNTFYIDPLGMFARISNEKTINNFISTIGNKNILSSFICITLPVHISLAVYTSKIMPRILYYIASGFGFAALMVSTSDSGLLGIGIFMVVFLIIIARKITFIKRFSLSIAVMLTFSKLVHFISYLNDDITKEIDKIQRFFIYSNEVYIIILAFALIAVLFYIIDYKKPNMTLSKAVPISLGVLAGLAVVSVISIMVYFSIFDTETKLGSLEKFLRFNYKWGTHRGYMWICSMEIFKDSTFLQKLFGFGPDTFYHAFEPYFMGLQKFGDSSTNAAHNEYINYLITIGITGILAYLTALFSIIYRAIRSAKTNPLAIVCLSAIIGYSAQAFINITQPITTPLFIIFLALTETAVRNADKDCNISEKL